MTSFAPQEPTILDRKHKSVSGVQARLDTVALAVASRFLRSASRGRLTLTLPSGVERVFGTGGGVDAHVKLKSYVPFWISLRRGGLGFAEAFMQGDVETDNLNAVFRYFLDNRTALTATFGKAFRVRKGDRRYHRQRRNTISGSRKNISEHYDLGNDFYALWLDPTLTYSSGIFADDAAMLEHAQNLKLERVLAALELRHGQSLLEIGCGWGELSMRAARAGAQVTAITLSSEQLAVVEQRASDAGLGSRLSVRLQDYRDVEGTFEGIVSIEMVEAVGEENWPLYFHTIRQSLKPDGLAVLQAITIRPEYFSAYRERPDFIQRYVFPGGMLPTEEHLRVHAAAAGLSFQKLETFGSSYARTLAEWRVRFEDAWPRIRSLGFDERFRRLWLYYLSYCEVGFDYGTIDVGHYRFRNVEERS